MDIIHPALDNASSANRCDLLPTQSELPRPIPWDSVESDLGCTSRIYFDNVTLRLHNVTLRHKDNANTITSVIAAKQTTRFMKTNSANQETGFSTVKSIYFFSRKPDELYKRQQE